MTQHEVVTGGRRYRLDLARPEKEVALEHDGAHHRDPAQIARDLARHHALRAAGWTVIQVDAAGFARPEVFLAQLALVLA